MINLENRIERDELIDDYFNKGYACDIREVYQAIVNTVADLEYEDVKKTKEIERLNNIINDLLNRQNEALRYIENHLSLDSRYKHGNGDKELTLVKNILNKHIKELKGSNDNE